MAKKSVRSCAYCGQGDSCRCPYRKGRIGGSSIQVHNTSRQSTVAEFREEFENITKNMEQTDNVTWMFSLTKIDPKKMEKSDAKRIADRLLGKEVNNDL